MGLSQIPPTVCPYKTDTFFYLSQEEKLFAKIHEIRNSINDDPFAEEAGLESPLRKHVKARNAGNGNGVATSREKSADLGLSLDGAMESAKAFFTGALRDGMRDVDFQQTITVKQSIETTIAVSNGEFFEGDLLEHMAGDSGDAPEATLDMTKVIPVRIGAFPNPDTLFTAPL